MKKHIIAGGPHTGKTSLIEALQKKYPDFYFVPEPATIIIEETGILPWEDYDLFVPLVIKKSFDLESSIPDDAMNVIFDRSIIDNIAYSTLQKRQDLHPSIWESVEEADYDHVFFCDFVGDYKQTDVRKESFETAKLIHQELKKAYGDSNLPMTRVPNKSIDERLDIMKACFAQ